MSGLWAQREFLLPIISIKSHSHSCAGEDIPEWFSFASVIQVLREAQQQQNGAAQ